MNDKLQNVIERLDQGLSKPLPPDKVLELAVGQTQAMALRYDIEDLPRCKLIIELLTEHFDGYEGEDRLSAFITLENAYCIAAFWDFDLYMQALEFRRPLEKRFYLPRRKVLKPVADAITDMMVHDKYDTIVLNTPPRIGKSTLGIMACTWVGGRDPEKQSLLTGYASALTNSFFKEINNITQDDLEYNYLKIFRDIRRVGQSAEWTLIDYAPTKSNRQDLARFPTFACRAIGGSLNGQVEAAALLYADDLTRGYEEALSIDQMDKLYGQYTSDLLGRAKEGFKQMHIGTRWSLYDPLGRIITSNEGNPRFKRIVIPALDENDESNFDYDYGVGFSTEFYKEQRRVLLADKENNGAVTWMCLYQQEAIERGSIVFPEADLKRADDLSFMERQPPDEMIAFIDVAFGGKDYLSMPIAAVYNNPQKDGSMKNDVYIVDWLFVNRLGFDITQPLVVAKARRWGITRIVLEANNGGDFYGRDLQEMFRRDGGEPVHVTSRVHAGKQSKLNRIEANEPLIKEFVFLDETCYNEDMYRNAMKQLTTFTRDGVNPHDDAPDSLAGLAAMLRTASVSPIQILDRRHL